MAITKRKVQRTSSADFDGVFILKVVLFFIVGMQWLWFVNSNGNRIPLPVGLFIGYVFALHEHFRIDRKIEYVVLIVAMFLGFWVNAGIFVHY